MSTKNTVVTTSINAEIVKPNSHMKSVNSHMSICDNQ